MQSTGLDKRLREARKRAGLTRRELARRVNATVQQIAKIEEGRIERPRNLEKIAMALDENPIWLQYGIKDLETIDRDVLLLAVRISKLPKHLHKHFWALAHSFALDHPEQKTPPDEADDAR